MEFHQLIQEMSWVQEFVTSTPTPDANTNGISNETSVSLLTFGGGGGGGGGKAIGDSLLITEENEKIIFGLSYFF